MTTLSSVSSYTTASSIQSRAIQEQSGKSYAGGNKAVYRITGNQANAAVIYPSVFPLKAPCSYRLTTRLCLLSSTGSTAAFASSTNTVIVQLTSGAALSFGTNVVDYAIPIAPSGIPSLTFAKNVSSDTVNITLDTTAVTSPSNFILEIEVFNNVNF